MLDSRQANDFLVHLPSMYFALDGNIVKSCYILQHVEVYPVWHAVCFLFTHFYSNIIFSIILCFREVSELVVSVIQARDLEASEVTGSLDSYVKVSLTPHRDGKVQTKVGVAIWHAEAALTSLRATNTNSLGGSQAGDVCCALLDSQPLTQSPVRPLLQLMASQPYMDIQTDKTMLFTDGLTCFHGYQKGEASAVHKWNQPLTRRARRETNVVHSHP